MGIKILRLTTASSRTQRGIGLSRHLPNQDYKEGPIRRSSRSRRTFSVRCCSQTASLRRHRSVVTSVPGCTPGAHRWKAGGGARTRVATEIARACMHAATVSVVPGEEHTSEDARPRLSTFRNARKSPRSRRQESGLDRRATQAGRDSVTALPSPPH